MLTGRVYWGEGGCGREQLGGSKEMGCLKGSVWGVGNDKRQWEKQRHGACVQRIMMMRGKRRECKEYGWLYEERESGLEKQEEQEGVERFVEEQEAVYRV